MDTDKWPDSWLAIWGEAVDLKLYTGDATRDFPVAVCDPLPMSQDMRSQEIVLQKAKDWKLRNLVENSLLAQHI